MTINIFDLFLKPWVGGILIKEPVPGKFSIMTQRRFVDPKYRAAYDPVNHLRDEVVLGLLSKPGEDCITGLLREVREECGMPPSWKPLKILGVSDEVLHNDDRQILALTSKEDYDQALEIFTKDAPLDERVWANGRGDRTLRYQPSQIPAGADHGYNPLCVVWNTGEPQQWLGPIFVVIAPSDFEPNYENADGEAGPHRWWTPDQLLETITDAPDLFMGPVIPALELVCEKLLAGKLFK